MLKYILNKVTPSTITLPQYKLRHRAQRVATCYPSQHKDIVVSRGQRLPTKTNIVDVNNLPLETGDNDDDEEIENDLPKKNGWKKEQKSES